MWKGTYIFYLQLLKYYVRLNLLISVDRVGKDGFHFGWLPPQGVQLEQEKLYCSKKKIFIESSHPQHSCSWRTIKSDWLQVAMNACDSV